MKKSILFVSALFASSIALAEVKDVQFAVATQVEILNVNVACVQRVNDKGESKGMKMFFADDSFLTVSEMSKKGLNETFIPGAEYCAPGKTGSLPVVTVTENTKSLDVTSAVLSGPGFKETRVIFYSNTDMANARTAAFNAL